MNTQVEDAHITKVRPLITPAVLIEEFTLKQSSLSLVRNTRGTIENILGGRDKKKIVIVGPCSIHDPDAAIEYAKALKVQTESFGNLLIVMRVYFEKPRTVVGWKGLINDPDIDNSFNINKGLRLARKLLLDISEIGLPCGTEFLDTTFGQYYADLISWGAIGARTAESQIHRELASGLSMPVGIKNRTDGNLQGAPAIFETRGNQYGHLILRGGDQSGPNFDDKSIKEAVVLLKEHELKTGLIVDCSHGNSEKDPRNQIKVIDSLCESIKGGQDAIKGVMIESHLKAGRQNYDPNNVEYGVSITDGCLSLAETIPLLEKLNSLEKEKDG